MDFYEQIKEKTTLQSHGLLGHCGASEELLLPGHELGFFEALRSPQNIDRAYRPYMRANSASTAVKIKYHVIDCKIMLQNYKETPTSRTTGLEGSMIHEVRNGKASKLLTH